MYAEMAYNMHQFEQALLSSSFPISINGREEICRKSSCVGSVQTYTPINTRGQNWW